MAYVNVVEWKTGQVCEWLKGLDSSVLPYVHSFMNHDVNGQQLLNLRSEDLEQLGVLKLGHQEIILEAVEYLRNFHYELDRENLQLLALRLSCQAFSLHNELSRQTNSRPVTTQTLADVASVMTAVKPLVRWLDRPPFSGQLEYNDRKADLLKLSLEMATCAQRDRFAEKPIEEIRMTCGQLAKLSDYIIQDIADPMILQPASLDLATLKKRPGDDLGFCILPSFHGAHQIAEIKFGSAAHQCGKMEEGDEIVQVNYQTVVGWERKNVLELFRECPTEVLLTLKRRPRHTKVYGQIYIKPYRLPSNKKTPYTTRWQHNLPSPRPELLTIPDFTMPVPRHVPKDPSPEPVNILDTVNMLDTMATDSSDSDSEIEPPSSIRLYSAKPRNLVQRRATITGASPTTKYDIDIEQFWRELKQEHSTTFQLRDKAASCAHGLDTVPSSLRPQTCLGIEQTKRKKKHNGQMDEKKVQFQEKLDEIETVRVNESDKFDKSSKQIQKPKLEPQKSVSFNINAVYCQNSIMDVDVNISNNISDIRVPLQKCNDEKDTKINESNVHHKERSKLDKSYSTPAYDLTENDFVERKLATIENHSKMSLISSGSRNASSPSLNKTDFHVNNDKEGDNVKSEDIVDIDQSDIDNLKVVGNVAKKVNIIEKSIRCADVEGKVYSPKVPEQMNVVRNIVNIKINNVDYDTSIEKNQSNIECMEKHFDSVNCSCVYDENYVSNNENNESETRKSNINNNSLANNSELDRKSSEEKSESTSSYNECTGSSSDGDATIKKFGEILETINYAMIERTKFVQKRALSKHVASSITDKNDSHLENAWTPVINTSAISAISDTSNFDTQKTDSCTNLSRTVQMAEADTETYMQIQNSGTPNLNVDTHNNVSPQFCQHSEISKVEQVKKPEINSRSAPPDPPPRKYFTKPAPLNLSSISNSLDNQKIPKVPERPCVRKDLKKSELLVEKCGMVDSLESYKNDRIETYRDFVEKSTNFIDEPSTPISEHKLTLLTDPYGYSEIYEGQFKEEKILLCGKHEMYNERIKNVNHLANEHNRTEYGLSNMDSPDGVGCSRQVQSPNLKCKTLEKDKCSEKNVVNRAMMVARSIGLHGSSSKPLGYSPRSSRKRNMLLAKRRNVSVKEIGTGDLEEWLTYRSRGAGGAWARAWFVLKGSSLYKFKTQDSMKADCLIALTGFTVSQASEVKSRKYAFKVYHTGTVFYFAATTDDSLAIWLDAINKATLGTDSYQTSGLFSETDESDVESKMKVKDVQTPDCKLSLEKLTFGSLKKTGRKDFGCKDHEMGGASLDRKYLRFLGARNQNVPVPTAQFRSYRRVLPTSTLIRKQNLIPNSPDLQVTVAGSTFYGLNASCSATDVPSSYDMSDYRRTTDRCHNSHGRRLDDFQGFITLEEFMLSNQEEDHRQALGNRSTSPNVTPLTSDHVHVQHRNFDYGTTYVHAKHFDDVLPNNGIIYGQAKNLDETSSTVNSTSYEFSRNIDEVHTQSQSTNVHHVQSEINDQSEQSSEQIKERSFSKSRQPIYGHRNPSELSCVYKSKPQESVVYYSVRQTDPTLGQTVSTESTHDRDRSDSKYNGRQHTAREQNKQMEIVCPCSAQIYEAKNQSRNDYEYSRRSIENDQARGSDIGDAIVGLHSVSKRFIRNDGHSGSSNNLASRTSSETLQRTRKVASVTRKGSFNLTDHCCDHLSSDKHWVDSLRRIDKKNVNLDKNRLKNVAQYQPPPIPNSPFDQDGMKPAFEMRLDKSEHIQKTNRLKSLFGSKSPQKPNTLDLPKEHQKTLLGSPRLHRALFRDKRSSQQQHQQHASRSSSQSPGDSGISQSLSSFSGASQSQTCNQSFSSASSISDWSPDTPMSNVTKCAMGHAACHTRLSNSNRNSLTPPTLPYIPPPTSPPPDYPGLEYPPVFEPGTYSLSDASLLGNRNKNSQTKDEQ